MAALLFLIVPAFIAAAATEDSPSVQQWPGDGLPVPSPSASSPSPSPAHALQASTTQAPPASTTQAPLAIHILGAEVEDSSRSGSQPPAIDKDAHDTFAPVPWLKHTSTAQPGFEVNIGKKRVEVASGSKTITNPYVIGGSVAAGVAGAATAIGLTAELAHHFEPTPVPTPAPPPRHGKFLSYLTHAVNAGDMVLPMLIETGFEVGYDVMIGDGAHFETKEIAGFPQQSRRLGTSSGSDMYLRLKTPLRYDHGRNTVVQAKMQQVSATHSPRAAFLKQAAGAPTPSLFGTSPDVKHVWIGAAVAAVVLVCCLCIGLSRMLLRPSRKQQKLSRAVHDTPADVAGPFEEMAPLVVIAPTKLSMVAPMQANYAAPMSGALVMSMAPTCTSSLARAPTYITAPPGTAI